MTTRSIVIRGARTHNLKNISVEIPQRQITVITGRSGSGKSSLAFDTLYAEGQRRFVESMSTYVRQFLERMERPDVDDIEGILPAIAVNQKNTVKNARSTVATATELSDSMRLFMTYCGETCCPRCGIVVQKENSESIARRVSESMQESRIVILAVMALTDETRLSIAQQLVKGGFYRLWVDGEIVDINNSGAPGGDEIRVVLGRFRVSDESRSSITEAIEQASSLSNGRVEVLEQSGETWLAHRFSARFSCDRCGDEFTEPVPQLFSFNSPLGACVECQGYGRVIGIDMEKVIPDRSQRLDEHPVAVWNTPGYEDCYEDLEKAAKKYRFRLDVPINDLTPEEWKVVYSGKGSWYGIKGFFDWLETKKYKIHVRVRLAKFRSYDACSSCKGTRLRPQSLNVKFRDMTIAGLFAMDVGSARRYWKYLPLSRREEEMAGHLRREILNRLVYLDEVGLSYLTLDRQTRSLSGGETQRINLASALGNALTETLYVVDEPTVGLHARDSERLLVVLRRLRDAGNTVVVVEHDPTIIRGADYRITLGPGAGEFGGRVIDSGGGDEPPAGAAEAESCDVSVAEGLQARSSIRIVGARANNLQNVDAEIPLQSLVTITGVSGSGKSTLIRNCLYNVYQRQFRGVTNLEVGHVDRIDGMELIDDIEFVDQSPIGRSSRSNPATYVKAWDEIRKILAGSTGAKRAGITAGMFSFNTVGGRCEECTGAGTVTIDMQFLADIEVVCDRCEGRRFGDPVLKVTYREKNVDDILRMTVDEAVRFFVDRRAVVKKLDGLRSVGLGYLRLGQSTASLSGGEAQRLKLASFLGATERGPKRLFMFDEPTTGLHSTDVDQLIATFRQLIERGHSVVAIEHNIQMILASDWVLDLGPEGGEGGGQLVAAGSPSEIASNPASITGRYLDLLKHT